MAKPTPTSAAKLTVILTELLDNITSLLPRSSLRALALTSKKTNLSAVDTLYKTYLSRTPPADAPFRLFLRTVCERPGLAAKVKEVDIRGWRSEYEVVTGAAWRGLTEQRNVDQTDRNGPSFSSTDKAVGNSSNERVRLFVEAAANAGLIARPASLSVLSLKSSMIWYTTLKEEGDFLRLLVRGVEDAHVILILALLPKLEVLRIDGLSPFPLLDWHHLLSRSSTALRSLRKLHINGYLTAVNEPVVMTNLQMLDIAPKLHELYLYDIAAAGHRFALKTLPSDKLTHLALINCGITRRLVRKMLDGQQLEQFAHRPGLSQVQAVTAANLSAKDILTSLATSNLSLKSLILFPVPLQDKPVSFRTFENLEDIEIPQPGVLNIPQGELDPDAIACLLQEQLPHTLCSLYLRYLAYHAQTKTILEQVAQLKMQRFFPALTMVRLNFQHSGSSSYTCMVGSFVVGSPAGGFTGTQTAWHPLPDVGPRLRHDLDKVYDKAGIALMVYQTDYSGSWGMMKLCGALRRYDEKAGSRYAISRGYPGCAHNVSYFACLGELQAHLFKP